MTSIMAELILLSENVCQWGEGGKVLVGDYTYYCRKRLGPCSCAECRKRAVTPEKRRSNDSAGLAFDELLRELVVHRSPVREHGEGRGAYGEGSRDWDWRSGHKR